jgi:hypothetical protein
MNGYVATNVSGTIIPVGGVFSFVAGDRIAYANLTANLAFFGYSHSLTV